MINAKKLALLALSLFLCAGLLTAQQTNAKIFGVVQLEDGSLVPGVTVEASSPKLVGKTTVVTDENGSFRFLSLTPGTYKLVFSLSGFQTVIRENIGLSIEQTLNLKVTMKLGNIEEMVTITGQLPLIDVKSTAKGMTLTKEVFQTLPKGRDFATLITAIPGVQSEAFLGGISVDGASGAENMFYMDGMEVSDVRGAEQVQSAAFEMVDEVQVKASGYQAEFGGSMGGVINVVTRSGGNEFHGEVLAYYSGSNLTGKERDTLRLDQYDPSKYEFVNYEDLYGKDKVNRLEGGFSLGGYIVKDKLWFFGTVLPVYRTTTRSIAWEEGGAKTDYDNKTTFYNFQGKLTATPAKDLRVSVGFINNGSADRGGLPNRDLSSNEAYAWSDVGFDVPIMSVSATADLTVGNNLMINARGGYFTQDNKQLKAPDGTYFYYLLYNSAAVADWPASSRRPQYWENYTWGDFYQQEKAHYTRMSANLDFNYFLKLGGEHSWKAGAQFVRVTDDINALCPYPMIILRIGRAFNYDTALGAVEPGYMGKYGYYENRTPFGTLADARSDRFALYIQDSWTIANRLTLNFGLRAETEKVPAFSDLPQYKDTIPLNFGIGDKLAPRFGFIWDVKGDASLKVFGSYGIFQDVMKLAMPEGSYGGDRWVSEYYELDTYNWDQIGVDGVFPGLYLGNLNWRLPSIEETDPDIKPMAQREISFGVEKKISDTISITGRFVQKHLIRAIEDIGFATAEGESYIIGNPGYGQSSMEDPIYPRCPKAKREYSAVNLSLEKRFSNNWMGGLSYTWSRLTGNYAGLNSSDEPGRNDPNVNRYWDYWFNMFDQKLVEIDGLLPTDRTHYFKAYGSYIFPFGLTLGTVINAYSGVPCTTEVVG